MLKLACPSCGAEVRFLSKASVFAVCSFCKSTLVRQDMDLKKTGIMADLQDDLTPLQVGTTGTYDGKRFEILGRLKIGYSEGFWNEWYVLFSGKEEAWLAEAQGFYAVCFPLEMDYSKVLNPRTIISPGQPLKLGKMGIFKIEDIRSVTCLFSEGELPIDAAQGRESQSIDLTGSNNQMATVEQTSDSIRIFCGTYQDFDEFNFQYLRHIDGW